MAIIEIEDEVNVQIKGVDVGLKDLFIERFSYYVPNYIFSPKYKMGWWDGKIKLFRPNGKTYLNLLEDIVPTLISHGHEIEVRDRRQEYDFGIHELIKEDYLCEYTLKGNPIIIRDYQLEAANRAIMQRQGILEMATGSGKTLTCGIIAKYFSTFGSFIVIVPTIDLAVQTQGLFNDIGLNAGIWYGKQKIHSHVMISTWQSLDNYPELFSNVIGFIVDEAHQAKAATLNKILSGPGANVPIRLGCTGTLPEDEIFRKQIYCTIGPSLFEISTYELQNRGDLAKTDISQFVLNDTEQKDYPRNGFEEWNDEVRWLFRNQERLEIVGEIIAEIHKTSGNTVILVNNKESGKKLEQELLKYCNNVMSLDGDDKSEKRMARYKEYETNDDVLTIVTTGIASTGIDIPRIFNLVIVEIGKKFEKILQTLGRGLRKAPDKDMLYMYDITSDSHFSVAHAKEKRRHLKKARQNVKVIELEY